MSVVLPVSMQSAIASNEVFFIELYTIQLRTFTLRIAACDEDITYAGNVYTAIPVQRDTTERSMDSIINDCTLRVADCSYEMLSYVMNGYDPRSSWCVCQRIQYPDSITDPKIFEWIFAGSLDEFSFANGVFECKAKARFPEIQCPNRSFQLACNAEFGDETCRASLATESIAISAVSGNTLTLAKSFPANYWLNGSVKCDGEARCITASNGNTITVNVNFFQTLNGKTAELSRGCNKTRNDCDRFGNRIHYSGFTAIPFESTWR